VKTFIVVNLKTEELLYFDCPIHAFNADMPKKPQDLIGYEPPNVEDFGLISVIGLLTIHEARRREMRYDSSEQKIIDRDGCLINVEAL
jgi:hypothetical protein